MKPERCLNLAGYHAVDVKQDWRILVNKTFLTIQFYTIVGGILGVEHLSPVWKRTFPLMITIGEECYVFDSEGQRYIDFTSGIGVVNTGHCHSEVVAAAQDSLGS
jgi:glutamate-1-semialdehyde aminotransferase